MGPQGSASAGSPSAVVLEVADDGQAFDLAEVHDKGGLGLIAMRERADKIGGQLDIDSAPGEGARVRISVQLASSLIWISDIIACIRHKSTLWGYYTKKIQYSNRGS